MKALHFHDHETFTPSSPGKTNLKTLEALPASTMARVRLEVFQESPWTTGFVIECSELDPGILLLTVAGLKTGIAEGLL